MMQVETAAKENTLALVRVVDGFGAAEGPEAAIQVALGAIREVWGWEYGGFYAVHRGVAERQAQFEQGVTPSGAARPAWDGVAVGAQGVAWRDLGGDVTQVAAPVWRNGEARGVLGFVFRGAVEDQLERARVLHTVARLLGQTLERFEESERQSEIVVNALAISQVLEALGAAETVAEAVKASLEELRSSFQFDCGSYWEIDPHSDRLRVQVMSGATLETLGQQVEPLTIARGEELNGRAWLDQDVVFVDEIAGFRDCPRMALLNRAGIGSALALPVIVRGEVLGVIDLFAKRRLQPSSERLNALRDLARIISSAVERIQNTQREREAQAELSRKVDSILEVVQMARAGVLNQQIEVQGEDAIGQVGEALSIFLEELRQDIVALQGTATSLSEASSELSSISQLFASNAEETSIQATKVSCTGEEVSRNIQMVAGTSEQLMASVEEISKSARESARIVRSAVQAAEAATETVSKLGVSSQQIGQVVKLITSIAQQTNLLALNATIEAARAGEAGKGFAVVANEVKELAKQTAKATEEISQKIALIQTDTKNAVQAINTIGTIISQVDDLSNAIAQAVQEQSTATSEIGRSVNEAALGVTEIARNIAGVAEAAQQTTRGAGETQSTSLKLRQLAGHIRELCAKFDL